jgi:hypothetical protein
MSIPSRSDPRQREAATTRWAVISYALDSTRRTVRLCAIMLAAAIPPGLLTLLLLLRH